MATIKQLPSGSYNALVYDYTDGKGKRHYKSITAESKREVKLLMAEFLARRDECKNMPDDGVTVCDAITRYIESKNNILSPSTLKAYNTILKHNLQSIMTIPVNKLTTADIQLAINREAEDNAPKTVRNVSSLLKASILFVSPDFKYKVTLPQKEKPDIQIPTEEEMMKIFSAVKGKRIEIPIYLGAICGMRRSEITALKWEDVDLKNGTLTVRAASVLSTDGTVVRKTTKTTASKRTIRLFAPVLKLLKEAEHTSEYVAGYPHPNRITDSFTTLLKDLGLPHYRFHDLRHYAASTMLLLNLPKKYICDYLGHETERMLETVYGHVMKDKKDNLLDIVDTHYALFFDKMQNKMQNGK